MTPLLYGRGKNDLKFSNNAKKKFNTVFGFYIELLIIISSTIYHEIIYFYHAAPLVMPPCFANSLIGVSHPGVPGLDILEIISI